MAPGMSTNEVYVDGLPVGSVFSFVWNGMISMSFQLVGFLLTYLLHTTHAAKNGSKAGLGLTLVQYGFYMKGGSGRSDAGTEQFAVPPDPNSHDFNPNSIGENAAAAVGAQGQSSGADALSHSITTSEWISYILMVVGWFILIRSVSEFLRARRHEQLVLQSPDRGLSIPVIAEGEQFRNCCLTTLFILLLGNGNGKLCRLELWSLFDRLLHGNCIVLLLVFICLAATHSHRIHCI